MEPTCKAARLCGLLFALVLLATAGPVRADAGSDCPPVARQTAEQMRAGIAAARDRGFLWRMRKDGRTSYLYGTIHAAQAEWMYPGPKVVEALLASDLIALELDLLDPRIAQRMQTGIALQADRAPTGSLADRLKAQLRLACLPEDMLTKLAPEMVAVTLVLAAARREGIDPAYGIDVVLSGWGRHGTGQQVVSLETTELQLGLLMRRITEESHLMTEEALDDLESRRAAPVLLRMARAWSEGNLGAAGLPNLIARLGYDVERVSLER